MASRSGAVHVVTTKRDYKGRTYTSHLLRRSFRVGDQVRNETLGNLSHLPAPLIDVIRRSLRGESFVAASDAFEIVASHHHGHIEAVRTAMRRLGVEQLIASRPSRERDLVCAMIAARIVAPHTKLATTRWWQTTTLPGDLGVADASEDELYEAMDWLLGRQGVIEQKLAKRHLAPACLVLYDLSSSYFEGTTCPLARLGHNRDGKKGKLQVNYGLLTDRRGCPIAVSVFDGNTSDSTTLAGQVEKLRAAFGLEQLVVVGDRGMISHKAITEELSARDGLTWITALRGERIRALVEQRSLQLGLFDERNLFELTHPDYPGERLIACRNPELLRLRAHKRQALLAATEQELETVRGMVGRGRLRGRDQIGVRVGRVINKYKVAKHFALTITDECFTFARQTAAIATEAALDGVYVIRTNAAPRTMDAAEAVRSYKRLANVERAFRSLKTVDLHVRPIHHHLEDRVRSHILLCVLAYYVEWHMREAWRPLTFADEDQAAKATRDPVARAQRSAAAHEKARTRLLPDGTPVHCFRTLLDELSTLVRNTCRPPRGNAEAATFELVTVATPQQRRALDLLEAITP